MNLDLFIHIQHKQIELLIKHARGLNWYIVFPNILQNFKKIKISGLKNAMLTFISILWINFYLLMD